MKQDNKNAENNEKPELVSGQYAFYRKVVEFFKSDTEVEVGEFNEKDNYFEIKVKELYKSMYLNNLIGGIHDFGGIKTFVKVVTTENPSIRDPKGSVPVAIFTGNKNFDRIAKVGKKFGRPVDSVLFKPVISQVYLDDAFNPDGVASYTYEKLATHILPYIKNTVFTTTSMRK